jgi:hypothetical protein
MTITIEYMSESASLPSQDLARYAWQLDVSGFGVEGQRRLKHATVFVSRVAGLSGLRRSLLSARIRPIRERCPHLCAQCAPLFNTCLMPNSDIRQSDCYCGPRHEAPSQTNHEATPLSLCCVAVAP